MFLMIRIWKLPAADRQLFIGPSWRPDTDLTQIINQSIYAIMNSCTYLYTDRSTSPAIYNQYTPNSKLTQNNISSFLRNHIRRDSSEGTRNTRVYRCINDTQARNTTDLELRVQDG